MHTIELTPEELRLLREAVHAFVDDFGHEEQDIVNALRAILAKLDDARRPV
jgi:UDP-N-acetylmuramate-alanine ligase